MATYTHGNTTVDVDDDGFLTQPEKWNEEVARALASAQGITVLSDQHWRVVRYLRSHYVKFGKAPMLRNLCKDTACPLKKVYELFPSGPSKGACKVAGLPSAEGCV